MEGKLQLVDVLRAQREEASLKGVVGSAVDTCFGLLVCLSSMAPLYFGKTLIFLWGAATSPTLYLCGLGQASTEFGAPKMSAYPCLARQKSHPFWNRYIPRRLYRTSNTGVGIDKP